MNTEEQTEFVLPTQMAKRRLFAGRLVLCVVCINAFLALVAAYILSGPMDWVTSFEFGFLTWACILYPTSLVLAVPIIAPVVFKVLKPPPETPGE
ncbi:MAG: hypothetical protein OXE44_05045 [Nitrospinae bacterium]|nr:hypothetical protein [Nitrospinota bacterium]